MNFLSHCWRRRWFRGLVWTFLTLVTFGVLFLAWINWSGARQWKATQAMLKAEGETLDFRSVMDDPISAEENFFAIPLLNDLALSVDNNASKGAPAEKRQRLMALKISSEDPHRPRPKLDNLALGTRADLQAWASFLQDKGPPASGKSEDAAAAVLSALARHDAVFAELAAGLSRPQAQWTPAWKTREFPRLLVDIALPHYTVMMGVNQTLALRAIAAARLGDAATARESAQIIGRVSMASLDEPFLIGMLVGASGVNLLCNLTWEFCADHVGTSDDYALLEAALAKLDLRHATLRAWRSETAMHADILQYLKAARADAPRVVGEVRGDGKLNAPSVFLTHLIASGFFDASSAVLVDRQFRYVVKPLRDEGLLAAHQSAQAWEKEIVAMKKEIWAHPSYLLASILTPVSSRTIDRAIYTQVMVDQATIACALERYRLEHGTYPDSLAMVKLATGQPLPLDIMAGQPMGYRKTSDGRYALWSVGFDGKDDGGKRGIDELHPENTNFSEAKYVGDWVWDFPAK
jgi:hypothetical protein